MAMLFDIYEAAGYEVSVDEEGRRLVDLDSRSGPESFEIVLKVIPTVIQRNLVDPDQVTFQIVLKGGVHLSNGGMIRDYEYNEEITLPLAQVRILKEE